jgi:hypothetical protein
MKSPTNRAIIHARLFNSMEQNRNKNRENRASSSPKRKEVSLSILMTKYSRIPVHYF